MHIGTVKKQWITIFKKIDTNKSYNQAILDIYNYNLKHKHVVLATHNEASSEIGQLLNQNKNIFSFVICKV